MKHKTLFRLMLKAIGVWVMITGTSQLLMYVSYMLRPSSWGMPSQVAWQFALQSVGPLFQIGAGLYLFFNGRWVADKAIPSNRPYCHECGYDLTGAVSNLCNECGTPFRAAPLAAVHE